jgi:serine/threonine-protein kinase
MLDIYRHVYTKEHYLHGIATSNLASVYSARKEFTRAEPLFREAIGIYERTQSPTHLNTAIGRAKLGRVLLRQGRLREAERELRAGLEILQAQASPSVSWITTAKTDLAEVYVALNQPAEAAKYK